MSDILDEAHAVAQCKDCPWYKSCVSPMRFTAEDIRRQLEQQGSAMGLPPSTDEGMQNLFASMAISAQNSIVEGCPIFIKRLKEDPELAKRVKELMQNWRQDE